ncbi:type II toxin-antitoxin system VapC family toxin [Brevibacterium album]|uniref:type II toxin-antitoxin system VapC family toxin n=1 Tax=Brevibacterium album TaxID=417948 RepID=UPI00041B95CE|nr:PIN domain-containing protein [Brevibacterium album]
MSERGPRAAWYIDSSIALRILLGHSRTAVEWFDAQAEAGSALISSRLLELEMTRVLRREGLGVTAAEAFTAELTLLRVDDALLREAAAIRPHVKSLDALHLASAQRIGPGHVTVVTHDAAMARVADTLGFDVFDPAAEH